MVPEDRSHQIQYFAKTFPSLLTLTLQTHFYLHFQESAENALWAVIAVKSETFTASESAPETYFETTYFMLFLQNLTKTLKKKLVIVIKFILMGQINFANISSFFCMLHLLLLEKTPQPCVAGEKFCLWRPTFISLPETLQIICIY